MIQAIENEHAFVTNLEKFMGKADKFIKTYYSGVSEQNHVREIMQEMKNLVSDTDLQQLFWHRVSILAIHIGIRIAIYAGRNISWLLWKPN